MMRFDMRSPAGGAATTELYAAALDMVAWAETRGCVMTVLSEHHASPDGYLPSPIVLASAMAARTTQMHFMVAAALLPLYDPVRLAEDMAVLDHVSGGRVSYVFGIGYRREEYEQFGVPYERRGRVADEKLVALLDALRGGVTPAPATAGGPAISWGGQSTAAARRAARFGLDFLAQTDGDELEAAYRDEAARLGTTPGNCMLPTPGQPLTVFVADDLDRAWDEIGPHILHDVRTYAAWNADTPYTASLSRGTTVDEVRAERGAHRIMTVAEAKEHVRAAGILPLHPLCGGLPPRLAWPYLERVVAEVL